MRAASSSKESMRAQVVCLELVAGTVGERVIFAEHDLLKRALASIVCATPAGADAFLRYVEAEVEALIRSHLHVVMALTDALVEYGTLTTDHWRRRRWRDVGGRTSASA